VKADFRRQFFQLIIRQQNLTLDHRDVVHYLLLTPGWGPAFFGRRLKQVIGQFNFQAVQLTDQPRPLFLSFPELRVFHQRLLFQFLSDVTRRVVDEMLVQQFLDGILLSPAPTRNCCTSISSTTRRVTSERNWKSNRWSSLMAFSSPQRRQINCTIRSAPSSS